MSGDMFRATRSSIRLQITSKELERNRLTSNTSDNVLAWTHCGAVRMWLPWVCICLRVHCYKCESFLFLACAGVCLLRCVLCLPYFVINVFLSSFSDCVGIFTWSCDNSWGGRGPTISLLFINPSHSAHKDQPSSSAVFTSSLKACTPHCSQLISAIYI